MHRRSAPSRTTPACTRAPSKADTEAAHGTSLAGRHSFDEPYATAVTYFKDSYRRDCTKHELLPIIARAYELQNRAEALVALNVFVARASPTGPKRGRREEAHREPLAGSRPRPLRLRRPSPRQRAPPPKRTLLRRWRLHRRRRRQWSPRALHAVAMDRRGRQGGGVGSVRSSWSLHCPVVLTWSHGAPSRRDGAVLPAR